MIKCRFEQAIARIDERNGQDPRVVREGGVGRPYEVWYSERLTGWVRKLCSSPSEALLLAARGQHMERWKWPRTDFPEGREGYLAWRSSLYEIHAREVCMLLEAAGYEEGLVGRVGVLIGKRGLPDDSEAQVLEDALCLLFLEKQLDVFRQGRDEGKVMDILKKTWLKMSAQGRKEAYQLGFSPEQQAFLKELEEEGGGREVRGDGS